MGEPVERWKADIVKAIIADDPVPIGYTLRQKKALLNSKFISRDGYRWERIPHWGGPQHLFHDPRCLDHWTDLQLGRQRRWPDFALRLPPLHFACLMGRLNCVDFLLRHGAKAAPLIGVYPHDFATKPRERQAILRIMEDVDEALERGELPRMKSGPTHPRRHLRPEDKLKKQTGGPPHVVDPIVNPDAGRAAAPAAGGLLGDAATAPPAAARDKDNVARKLAQRRAQGNLPPEPVGAHVLPALNTSHSPLQDTNNSLLGRYGHGSQAKHARLSEAAPSVTFTVMDGSAQPQVAGPTTTKERGGNTRRHRGQRRGKGSSGRRPRAAEKARAGDDASSASSGTAQGEPATKTPRVDKAAEATASADALATPTRAEAADEPEGASGGAGGPVVTNFLSALDADGSLASARTDDTRGGRGGEDIEDVDGDSHRASPLRESQDRDWDRLPSPRYYHTDETGHADVNEVAHDLPISTMSPVRSQARRKQVDRQLQRHASKRRAGKDALVLISDPDSRRDVHALPDGATGSSRLARRASRRHQHAQAERDRRAARHRGHEHARGRRRARADDPDARRRHPGSDELAALLGSPEPHNSSFGDGSGSGLSGAEGSFREVSAWGGEMDGSPQPTLGGGDEATPVLPSEAPEPASLEGESGSRGGVGGDGAVKHGDALVEQRSLKKSPSKRRARPLPAQRGSARNMVKRSPTKHRGRASSKDADVYAPPEHREGRFEPPQWSSSDADIGSRAPPPGRPPAAALVLPAIGSSRDLMRGR